MKAKSILTIFTFILIFCASETFAESKMAELSDVAISLNDVHPPSGFDSNDPNVEVIVTGELPNTCYRRPFGTTSIKEGHIYIEMKASKIVDRDIQCIQAITPYMVSVPLGQLQQGQYEITINDGKPSQKITNINIEAPGSNSIDNYNYANVTKITKINDAWAVRLEGEHPSTCIEIDRVEVKPNKSGNTFAILPIVKQAHEICDRMMKPFSVDVSLPNLDNKKSVVLHVRRMLGERINYSLKW